MFLQNHQQSLFKVGEFKFETQKEAEKLIFQPVLTNEKKRKDIDHSKSDHAKALQQSRYLQIDNDIQARNIDIDTAANTLDVNYCKAE